MREVYLTRQVSCLLRPELNRPGFNAANLIHDAEVMLEQGEHYGLTPKDDAFLLHALRCCIRPAPDALEGFEVSMSSRQWAVFVAMRRAFIRAFRNPQTLSSRLSTKFPVTSQKKAEPTQ